MEIEKLKNEKKILELKTELDVLRKNINISPFEFNLIYNITNTKLKREILNKETEYIKKIIRLLKRVQNEDITDLTDKLKIAEDDVNEAQKKYNDNGKTQADLDDLDNKKKDFENIKELINAIAIQPTFQIKIKQKELDQPPFFNFIFRKKTSEEIRKETNKIIEKEIKELKNQMETNNENEQKLNEKIKLWESQQKQFKNAFIPGWYTYFPQPLVVTTPQKEKEENRLMDEREQEQKQIKEKEKEQKQIKEEKEKEQKRIKEEKEKEQKQIKEEKEKEQKQIKEEKEKEQKRIKEEKEKEQKRIKEEKEKEQKRIKEEKEKEQKRIREEKEKEQKRIKEEEEIEEIIAEKKYNENRQILIAKEKERIKLHNEEVDRIKDELIRNLFRKNKNSIVIEGKKQKLKGKELGKFIAKHIRTKKEQKSISPNKTKKRTPSPIFQPQPKPFVQSQLQQPKPFVQPQQQPKPFVQPQLQQPKPFVQPQQQPKPFVQSQLQQLKPFVQPQQQPKPFVQSQLQLKPFVQPQQQLKPFVQSQLQQPQPFVQPQPQPLQQQIRLKTPPRVKTPRLKTPSPKNVTIKCPPRCPNGNRCKVGICIKNKN
jgi:hypothetical protein